MAVVDLAINKEGGFMAAAYDDGQIEIWEADTRRLQCTVNTNGALCSVAFSPSGDRLIAGGRDDGQITIWEVSAKTDVLNMQTRFYAGAVRNLTFTHDGRRIISIGKSPAIDFWDPTNGRRVFSLPCSAQVAALSPDGFRLAWASRTGTVGICEGQ
jgi:WD40 repeat protein